MKHLQRAAAQLDEDDLWPERHLQRVPAPLDEDDLWPEEIEIAALEVWIEQRWRQRVVRTVAYALLAAVVGGAAAIAYTREGSDAIADWVTMGHTAEARARVSHWLGRR